MFVDGPEPQQTPLSGTKVGIAAGASTPGGNIRGHRRNRTNINASINEEKGMAVTEENFEQMLEESLKPLQQATVNGIITSISANGIHVDLASNAPVSSRFPDYRRIGADLEMFNVGDGLKL